MRRVKFNGYVATEDYAMPKFLQAIVADAGFEANVCNIYGICSKRENGEIKAAGWLGKIPRPRNMKDMERLEAMPTFDLMAFKAVVEEAELREVGVENKKLPSKEQADGEQRDIPVNRLSTRSFANELMTSPSAWERSKGVAMLLTQRLGRLPQPAEASAMYEALGLGTLAPERDRDKRHQRAIRSLEKSFDPAKASGYSYTVGQYLPTLNAFVTEESLRLAARDAGYPRRLLLQDLDIALGFHVKQTLRMPEEKEHRFTVPVDGMIAWFRSLKRDGLVNRSCNYSKVRAVRLALLRAGMISVLDDSYKRKSVSPDGIGIAKRWGLGRNCPQFAEYAASAAHARPATSRKGHVTSMKH